MKMRTWPLRERPCNATIDLFNWRDAPGNQHHKSTGTNDPQEALRFKLDFLAKREGKVEEIEADTQNLSKLPLSKVSEMYFGWRSAKCSAATIEREEVALIAGNYR